MTTNIYIPELPGEYAENLADVSLGAEIREWARWQVLVCSRSNYGRVRSPAWLQALANGSLEKWPAVIGIVKELLNR